MKPIIEKIRDKNKQVDKNKQQVISSPLAKYDSKGNLHCIICKSLIKSATIWKVHINSKQHKANVEEAKQLDKKLLQNDLNKNKPTSDALNANKTNLNQQKLKDIPSNNINKENTQQKPKGILTNNDNATKKVINTSAPQESSAAEVLPEMFFDDPVIDAKARNVEYKNVDDDEWDRFQREIKEESVTSNILIAGEQTHSAVERELTEISEQIHQWSKVIDLENKLQKIIKTNKRNVELEESDEDMSDDDEDVDVEDNLDWRSKKIKF